MSFFPLAQTKVGDFSQSAGEGKNFWSFLAGEKPGGTRLENDVENDLHSWYSWWVFHIYPSYFTGGNIKVSGWWLIPTPLKNMKVSWDDDIPNNYMESPKSHVPNHQPDIVDPHLQTKIETAWNCWVFGFISSYLIPRNSARLHRVRISSSATGTESNLKPKKTCVKNYSMSNLEDPEVQLYLENTGQTLPIQLATTSGGGTVSKSQTPACHRSWDGYILRPTESSWVVASVNVIQPYLSQS